MDRTLQGYMLTRMDRQEELLRTQIALQKAILAAIKGQQKDTSPPGIWARLKLPPFSQILIGGACSWGLSSAIGSYLSHGGDPLKLIEAFLKFFG